MTARKTKVGNTKLSLIVFQRKEKYNTTSDSAFNIYKNSTTAWVSDRRFQSDLDKAILLFLFLRLDICNIPEN